MSKNAINIFPQWHLVCKVRNCLYYLFFLLKNKESTITIYGFELEKMLTIALNHMQDLKAKNGRMIFWVKGNQGDNL